MLRASCGDDDALAAQIGDGDVAFVLEHCDTDGDQKITRDEVLPMLAMWRNMMQDIKERHVSSDSLTSAAETTSQSTTTPSPTPNCSKTSSMCTLL